MSLGKHLLILEIFQETASEFVISKNPLQTIMNFSPSSPTYGAIYRITGCFLNAAF
jgi:hypothetical protein